MRVLVVGGAGYIGSHMIKCLLRDGHEVIVFDNFSTGHRNAILGGMVVKGDLSSRTDLDRVFNGTKIDTVMHFASCIQVGESVRDPGKYYLNNVAGSINLLNAMTRHDVRSMVFSSTAAVFGIPESLPIKEDHPKHPINPYGRSKFFVEQILEDFEIAHGIRSVRLRYFNAAGADPDGSLGERHDPETHLIPLILQTASGRKNSITIFGDDYDTPDGTCIRDYVHVMDLCAAHIQALEYLARNLPSESFNLGNGMGFSVREVVNASIRVTGASINVKFGPRREGDPPRLVADATRARRVLGWNPTYSELDAIVAHAWAWELSRRR